MLARGTHPLRPIIAATRANNPAAQHLFRRDFAGYVVRGANAGTIKRLEAKIRAINASSHSATFKYRNSVRLFAMIDHAKVCMEFAALRTKAAPISFNQFLQAGSKQQSAEQKAADKACNAWLANAKETFQKGR
jgi:hypothetical protein